MTACAAASSAATDPESTETLKGAQIGSQRLRERFQQEFAWLGPDAQQAVEGAMRVIEREMAMLDEVEALRTKVARVEALVSEWAGVAKSERANQKATTGEVSEYWAGCADTRYEVMRDLRAALGVDAARAAGGAA